MYLTARELLEASVIYNVDHSTQNKTHDNMSAAATKNMMHGKLQTDMLEEIARKEQTAGEQTHHSASVNEIHMMEAVARKEKTYQVHEEKNQALFDEIRMRGPDGANALRNIEAEMMEAVARKEREKQGDHPPKYWKNEMQGVHSEVEFLGKMETLINKM
jgi:hypothetical protein